METVVRVAIIYAFLIIGLRLMGKREFSQLSALELVMLLLIPELVSQGVLAEDYSLTNALIAAATLLTLVFLNSLLSYRSRRVEKAMASSPTLLVADGKVLEDNLDHERITASELFGEMRKSGIDELEQVRWAVLEGDGRISIVPKKDG